jgi:hypothetical protein
MIISKKALVKIMVSARVLEDNSIIAFRNGLGAYKHNRGV